VSPAYRSTCPCRRRVARKLETRDKIISRVYGGRGRGGGETDRCVRGITIYYDRSRRDEHIARRPLRNGLTDGRLVEHELDDEARCRWSNSLYRTGISAATRISSSTTLNRVDAIGSAIIVDRITRARGTRIRQMRSMSFLAQISCACAGIP